MESNWKKYLLKSGLPFEYEVKECFVKNGCTIWDEFSYLKEDESKIEKEFSYDLDANAWIEGHSLDFMIECKYKTEPTKWFFTPDPYAYQNDLNQNSFFHSIDCFSENGFLFNKMPYYKLSEKKLGPFCLKGVEIYKNQHLETNITKAIKQLSYAFIDKYIGHLDSQLNIEMFHKSVFLQIPVIITNAELYLLRENLTTTQIEEADSIEEISSRHDFLLYHNQVGEHLRNYNISKLVSFFSTVRKDQMKKRFRTFTTDLEHFINVIASTYSPEVILLMHHDRLHENYGVLFDYINFHLKDSERRTTRIGEVNQEIEAIKGKFESSSKK